MTEPQAPALDVPIRPIRPRGGRDLRAWLVALAALSVAATAGGFAILSRPTAPDTAALASQSPRVSPSPTSTPSVYASATPRVETLPDIANVAMPGAPSPVFFRRVDDRAEVIAWEPGRPELNGLGVIPDAFADFAAGPLLIGILAPDKRSIFVRGFDSATSGQADRGRLTSADGARWTTSELTSTFGLAWAPDSRSMVVSVGAATWVVVELGDGEATDREIVIDPDLEPLRPRQPGLEAPRLTPAGFSADGRSIYGMKSRGDGTFLPAVRVSVADGSVETVAAFPIEGPEAIVRSDALPSTLDPATGRSIDPRAIGFLPDRPGHLEVHEPDGSIAWSADVETVLSAAWIGGGRLLVSEAARYPNPIGTRVRVVQQDGFPRSALLTTGPVAGTSVASVFDDYALVGIAVERPEQAVLVCVLRLSDGTVSAIRLTGSDLEGLQLGGWLSRLP
jgi:hypothetical protein